MRETRDAEKRETPRTSHERTLGNLQSTSPAQGENRGHQGSKPHPRIETSRRANGPREPNASGNTEGRISRFLRENTEGRR